MFQGGSLAAAAYRLTVKQLSAPCGFSSCQFGPAGLKRRIQGGSPACNTVVYLGPFFCPQVSIHVGS